MIFVCMRCDTPFVKNDIPLPCGRCPPCKKRRVDSWVFRLMEEDKISSSSYFITLTYNTAHVPISKNGYMTLRKEDYQLYMKRLRKLSPDSEIKYYAVGEYGSTNNRPHYHAIIFNVPDPQNLVDAWSLGGVPIGTVHVGAVSGDSVAYTMKYIDKPYKKRLHVRDDRAFEFPLMSKKLGVSYLSKAVVNYHKADISRLYVTKPGGHKIALPRYFRLKIYDDEQLSEQTALIHCEVMEQLSLEERRFNLLYPHRPDYTFPQYKEDEKAGRFISSLNQKNRDI